MTSEQESPKEPIATLDARIGHEDAHGGAVRSMFDRISPTYDRVNRLLSAGLDVRWRKRAVSLLSPPPARVPSGLPAGEILDSCAGTLDLSAEVERAFFDRKIVALDFAADMLERGKGKVSRTETVVGDAMSLPFESERFAAVICGFGLRNLADPVLGLAEAVRVLAPGGRLVILEFFQPRHGAGGAVTRAFHAVYARAVLPTVGGVIAGDRDAYAYLAKSMAAFLPRAEVEAHLQRLGLVEVVGEDLTLGVASIVSGTKPAKRAST